MPSIKCTCGKLILVRESQAGTSVQCECGQELIIPGLRMLRSQELQGAPIPGILPGKETQPVALEDRQFLVFLTHPRVLPHRISFDAASHFVTACDRLLHRYFEEVGEQWKVDLQVSLALLPNGETLVDIQVQPPIVPTQDIGELVDQLQQMPHPPVTHGPVAFTIRKPMGGGAPRVPVFDFPFRNLMRRPAELDQMLMEAGGMTWSAAPDTPSGRRSTALWSRLQALLRWALRRERPEAKGVSPAEPETALSSSFEEQEILAALQSDSTTQVEACLKHHPYVLPLYHYLGQLHVHGGDFQQAVDVFSQLIGRDPENLAAYAGRGRAHVMAGSMRQGLADYTKAIEGNPADAESRAARAMIYLELEAWEFAEEDLTAAIELAPIQPQLYVERARVRYAQQKIADVLQDLQLAHRLDPYHVDACMLHGWTLQHRPNATLQDIADAAEYYGRAIQLDPQNPGYYVQRAEAYASQNKYALTIADCDRALQLDRNNAIAYGIRGYANQQLDHLSEAVVDCSRAIELGLRSAAVYVSRAVGYAATGEIDLALADCDTAVELSPDYAAAFNYRGMLRLGQGDIESATEDFAEACRLAPEWSTPREYRADAHRMQSEFEQAIDQYTHTIELQPGNLTAYVGRALAWMEKEELDKAWQDLTEAIRLDEECVPAYFHRAELLLRQEQFQRALTDLDKAISLDPDFAPGYHTRGQVYLHLQMNEQAIRDFSKLIELHPTWPGAYLGRANAWIHLGDSHKASADYHEAANLDPGSTEELIVHRLIVEAQHLHKQEQYEDAIAKATEALDLDEICLPAFATRAASYWYSEHFVEAVDDYSQLLELASNATFAYVGRGQVYVELGEYETALEDLNKSVELERKANSQTGLAYALSGRALAYSGLQRFAEAQRDFDESMRLRPDNAWVHYNRGLMFHMRDDLPHAIESFRQALSVTDPPLTKRKRERAEAFLQQHR